jgi:hypothetical protein
LIGALTAVGVYEAAGLGTHGITLGVKAILAAAVVVVISTRPWPCLLVVVVLLPVQPVLLGVLFHEGLPAELVRSLGFFQEATTAGVVLAAVREVRHGHSPRFDALDGWIAAYLGVLTVYLLAPLLGTHALGDQPLYNRVIAWRTDGEFAVLLLAVRRLPWTVTVARRLTRAAIGIGVCVAAGAVVNVASPGEWSHFVNQFADMPAYQAQILRSPPIAQLVYGTVGSHTVVRAGSTLLNELYLGFYLIVPLALLLARAGRGGLRRPVVVAATIVAVGIVLTLTRSAVGAAALTSYLMLSTAAASGWRGTRALTLVLVTGLILAIPLAAATEFTARVTSQAADNGAHVSSTTGAFDDFLAAPMGRGLGTSAAVGARFASDERLTSEDAYLQTANEVGGFGLITFAGLLVQWAVQLRRRARSAGNGAALAGALWAALVGIMAGGLFLQVWLDLTMPLTLGILGGLALSVRGPVSAPPRRGTTLGWSP